MCLEGLLRSLIPFRNSVIKLRRSWADFPASSGDSTVLGPARAEAVGMGNALQSLMPWLGHSMPVFLPTHLSCIVFFWIWAIMHKTTGKGIKNLRKISPCCVHNLNFSWTKWLICNTQQAQVFPPCHCLAMRRRSLLQSWDHRLLFSLQDFPCKWIENLYSELQLFFSWNAYFFSLHLFLWKGVTSKENIFISKLKEGGLQISSKVRLLL